MAQKQTPESIPPWLTSHLLHASSMYNPTMFGDDPTKIDPHRNKITSLQSGYRERVLFSELFDKQAVNNFEKFNQSKVPQLEDEIPKKTMNNDRQVPTSCPPLAAASARDNHILQGKPRSGYAPDSKPQKDLVPDEESEADGLPSFRIHGRSSAQNIAMKGKHVEQVVPSSSEYSREASNSPIYTLKRRYDHGDTGLSENNEMEETHETTKATRSKCSKRKRKPEVHSLSERRRRDKINKKMRALQELVPNCNKVDKASMLDEAIEYLKTLQLQVQMMSMGKSGVYMPQMMLPASAARIFGGYSAIGAGMQMGLGYYPAAQFSSITSIVPGINQPRVNMFGLPVPGQMLLMSPFVFLPARFPPHHLVRTPAVSQAAAIAAAGFNQTTPMYSNRTR